MKRFAPLLALVFVFSIFASKTYPAEFYSPRPDGKYDNSTYLVDPEKHSFSKALQSIVKIRIRTVFKVPEWIRPPGDKTTDEQVSDTFALVLENRVLITLAHVVVRSGVVVNTPQGLMRVPAEKLSEDVFVVKNSAEHKLKPLYVDGEDVAFFEIPKDVSVRPFPYSLGNSDELEIGNLVYVLGNPMLSGLNVREGIVSALSFPDFKDAFSVSNGVYPGDSGMPAIAIRDGKFELVGLAQVALSDGRIYAAHVGGVLSINTIRRAILEKCQKCSDEIKKFFSHLK